MSVFLPAGLGKNRSNLLRAVAMATVSVALSVHANGTFHKVLGIENSRVRQIERSKEHPNFMAAASDNALYLSMDAGSNFVKSASLKNETINYIFIPNGSVESVYLAGSRNGYVVQKSSSPKRIFTTGEDEELHFILQHKGALFAGTSKGLYVTDDMQVNWKAVSALREEAVYSMEISGNDLYLACDSGVYLYRTDGTLKRLFIARRAGTERTIPYQIRVDTMTPSRLWLCTSNGVYFSVDRGTTWQKFYTVGTGNATATCLAQFPLDGNHFYLCSEAGFFKVDITTGESQSLFSGLPTSKIRWTDISDSGEIYLATDQGLFKQGDADPAPRVSRNGLADILEGEPSIHEVQEAAMRYNSVDPEKTGAWKRRLKYRALLPKLDVDYDKTIGSSFTSSGYYYAEGPNDWGVSLTWDMGNLIWNSYEDDVDNRTKLTTQLRLDILDEVNRLYFERLRLKHEIALVMPGTEDTTLKQLRLYELTATLDGYTGGLFSQQR